MSQAKLLNEVENVIIFCIAAVLLSFFFYFVLDFQSNISEGFAFNLSLVIKRFLLFLVGGSIVSVVQFIRIRKWNFNLFFWVNISIVLIFMIIDITFKLS